MLLLRTILACFLVVSTSACKLVTWHHFSMEKILYFADIVVYGRETGRYLVDPSDINGQQNAKFEVYCVLKNDNLNRPLSHTITIERVFPVTSCSGTEVPPNTDVLLALTRTDSSNFLWHEVNPTPDGAVFPVSSDGRELQAALRVCGLRAPVPPSGRNENLVPTCPRPTAVSGGCNEYNVGSGQHKLNNAKFLMAVGLIIVLMHHLER